MALQLNRSFRKAAVFVLIIISSSACRREFVKNGSNETPEQNPIFVELSDLNPTNRAKAIADLQRMGTNAVPILLNEIDAIGAMSRSTNREIKLTATARRFSLNVAVDTLTNELALFGKEIEARLMPGKNAADAASILARLRGPYSRTVLTAASSESEEVRIAAIHSLYNFADDEALSRESVPLLIAGLSDTSTAVRQISVYNLRRFHTSPEISIPKLIYVVEHDPDEMVRLFSAQAIRQFGAAAKTFEAQLQKIQEKERSPEVRSAIGRTLDVINDSDTR